MPSQRCFPLPSKLKTASPFRNVIESLGRVDWDFPRSSTPIASVHTLHWFPGNFIPQLPSFLIQILSNPGDLVFDPFCGSGTTGVEALRLGREAWLSDASHASIQVTNGKLAVVRNSGLLTEVEALLEALVLDFSLASAAASAKSTPANSELLYWFHPVTLQQLNYLWSLVSASRSTTNRAALEMIFTDTLFSCASPVGAKTKTGKRRNHHWGWVADNVKPHDLFPHNAFAAFRERLHRLRTVLQAEAPATGKIIRVTRSDIRSSNVSDSTVDLIVTSPPYLGMIDYTLANRLTYIWMNWPLQSDIALEIGARRYRNRPSALNDYLHAMEAAAGQMHRILRKGGYCALVIGSSRAYPDTVNAVIKLFAEKFHLVWGPQPRTPSNRRIAERKGTKGEEFVVVFAK